MGIALALDLLLSIWNCSTTMKRIHHTVDPSLTPMHVAMSALHAKFVVQGVLYLLRKVSFATYSFQD